MIRVRVCKKERSKKGKKGTQGRKEGKRGRRQEGGNGEEETGPSVQELDAERAILHEVTQRTCDGGGPRGGPQGGTEGAPEGGEELCEGMRERLRAFEEYYHEALVEAQLKDQQLDTHRQTKSHLAWAGPHKACLQHVLIDATQTTMWPVSPGPQS